MSGYKIWWGIYFFLVLLIIGSQPVEAAVQGMDNLGGTSDEADNPGGAYSDSLMNDMELGEIQEIMDEVLKDKTFSFGAAIKEMIQGKQPFTKETIFGILIDLVTDELGNQKERFGGILVLVLAGAILTSFVGIFDNNRIGEICFYMVYLLLFAMMVKSFGSLSRELEGSLNTVVSFMRALAPAYYIAITAAGGLSSATIFYQVILIIIFCVEYIMMAIILPGINVYVLLELINLLTKEEVLTRISELLKSIILWALKTMLAVIIGMQMIQGLVAPAIDTLKRSLLGKTVSVIPGVGNAMNAVTEIIFGSAVLIRNCLGVTALVVLVIFSIVPVVKLTLTGFVYKFLGAVIQPISDKRIVGCLHAMGESCGLLLKVLFTTQVLFMLTIVILANTLK